ncbi:hypothetical protein [Sphingomonas abietis]|uniref:Uncharacterized protein n=1 Tax=Sphingomonas abietis TaxID=3012344 RepID=A0ABY7NUM3_9SPHN|nr:hypothetical protein [Sphingomonas abietis]WBO23609.1 hypothetical protein PBT88_05665 [Sphingomonas abietis]
MADYRDMPGSARLDGERSGGLLIDQRSLTIRQKILQMASIFLWVSLGLAVVVYLGAPRDQWLDQARSSSAMTSLWFQPDGWIVTAFMVPMILGGVVLVLNLRAMLKLTVLALLFATLVGGTALAQRGYVMVMDDRVLIHPALPWHHDVYFALADATVTARGCHLWHSKSTAHHQIIFKVRGGPDGGQTVDLGEAADRDIGAWLAVMRDYDDGYLPFPEQAGRHAAHDPECLRYWLDGLSSQQASQFARLLG